MNMNKYVLQCPHCGHWRGFIPKKPVSWLTQFRCYHCHSMVDVKNNEGQFVINHVSATDLDMPLTVQQLNKGWFEGGPSF